MHRAKIITIGNEILNGKLIDTNSALISRCLNEIGFETISKVTVGDNIHDIIRAIGDDSVPVALKIYSGGLGPTHDDKTKAAACKFFNSTLVLNELVLQHITKIFTERNLPITETNKAQALVPHNAIILHNEKGTAPGLLFQQHNTIHIFLPAVPFELEHLMRTMVLPWLRNHFPDAKPAVYCDFLFSGIGESFLFDLIDKKTDILQSDVETAFLPSPGYVIFRIKIPPGNTNAENIFKQHEELLKTIAPQNFIGRNVSNIAEAIQNIFVRKGMTIAVAESCTGGYISHLITSNPGSSAWFRGSIIAYSNDIKTHLLGVDRNIIETKGAVSEEVVKAMAEGVKKISASNYGLAVSGIAGPGGGSTEKPVGTVWIALATNEKMYTQLFSFGNIQRSVIIQRAANSALLMVLNECRTKTEKM